MARPLGERKTRWIRDRGPADMDQPLSIDMPLNRLAFLLQRAMEHVAYALRGLSSLQKRRPRMAALPEGIPWGMGTSLDPRIPNTEAAIQIHRPLAFDEALSSSRRWILTCALKDAIAALHLYFEELRAIGLLARAQAAGRAITAKDFRDEIAVDSPAGKRFHKMGLPDKWTTLKSTLEISVAGEIDDLWKCVVSLNAARNCLEHRDGFVEAKTDANNDDTSALVVRWREAMVLLDPKTGERLRKRQGVIRAPNGITIQRQLPIERAFPVNDRVHFNEQEFVDITWTLKTFGELLLGSLIATIESSPKNGSSEPNETQKIP